MPSTLGRRAAVIQRCGGVRRVLGVGPGVIPMVCGVIATQAGGMEKIRTSLARQGLVRSTDRAIIGGVCAGVGRRLGLTPWVTRLLFLVTLVVIPGASSWSTRCSGS